MNPNDPADALERKKTIAGCFHRASATYDHVGPNFFSYFGHQLVDHAALPWDACVLDVAAGRGAVLFPAAEAVGPQGSVTGIDLAEGMVQATRREILERGLSNAYMRQMDAEHLDFPDSSFDALLSGFALFFFPQPERALTEFHRALKPGGRLALTTWGGFDKRWEWFYKLTEKYLPSPPQPSQPPTSPAPPKFDTPEGMESMLQAAGFTDIQVISETVDFTYVTKEEWWESLWSHGSRAALERIEKTSGSAALAQFKTDCFEQINAENGSEDFQRSYHALYTLAVKPL
jgi:ubiquinone/menaquinone biosynthesis C-methylase UbiE